MTTLKETVNKLTKLYSDLNDCIDGFTCSMIINDIELVIKSYGRECSKASLLKASENVRMKTKDNVHELSMMDDWSELDKESISNPDNIILL